MVLRKKVLRRAGPKDLMERENEPPVYDDYRVEAFCRHGITVANRFVDEEHGERDVAQALEVVVEYDEAPCQCVHFVDEEGEE